jgi:hypothetical protein
MDDTARAAAAAAPEIDDPLAANSPNPAYRCPTPSTSPATPASSTSPAPSPILSARTW